MTEEQIRIYAKLMEETGLTGLEITEDNKSIRLERAAAGVVYSAPVAPVPSSAAAGIPEDAKTDNAACFDVISPMVGVFYASPAENADPFIKKGDTVHAGDTLGIIEAMKLMNEITAEKDGIVEEICVKNGQVVEYGTVLFRLR